MSLRYFPVIVVLDNDSSRSCSRPGQGRDSAAVNLSAGRRVHERQVYREQVLMGERCHN